MADFQNRLHSQLFVVNFSSGFCTEQLYVLLEWFFACFWNFLFLTQTDYFAKAIAFAWAIYSLCKMADSQNRLISRVFSVF